MIGQDSMHVQHTTFDLLSTPACLITFMPVSQVALDRLIPVPYTDSEEQKKSWQGQTTTLLFSSDAKIRESPPKVLDCTYRYRPPRPTPSKLEQSALWYGLPSLRLDKTEGDSLHKSMDSSMISRGPQPQQTSALHSA